MHVAVPHNQHFSVLNLKRSSPCTSAVPQMLQLDAQVCFLIDERPIWLSHLPHNQFEIPVQMPALPIMTTNSG